MEKHIWAVYAEPTPGMDQEFETWYHEHHLPDMLSVGFKKCIMTKASPLFDQPQRKYMIIYEYEGELQNLFNELGKAKEEERFYISPAFDENNKAEFVYEVIEVMEK